MSEHPFALGCCSVFILAVSAAEIAYGQSVALEPGARIRVRRAEGNRTVTLVADLVSVTPESLVYRVARDQAIAVMARDSIVGVEQSMPDGHQIIRGAVLGLLGGAAVGVISGIVYARSGCTEPSGDCLQGLGAGIGGAVGAVVGLLAGVVVGSRVEGERWEPVQLPQRLGFVPHRERRATLGLSVQFSY